MVVGGPRCETDPQKHDSETRYFLEATRTPDGGRGTNAVAGCTRLAADGAAICERNGQLEAWRSRTTRELLELEMSGLDDLQWCFPSRRQHAGVLSAATPEANGANTVQAITTSAKLATIRRMVIIGR